MVSLLFPFLKRWKATIENIHYVKIKDKLIPVGDTEFAQDRTFGLKMMSSWGLY